MEFKQSKFYKCLKNVQSSLNANKLSGPVKKYDTKMFKCRAKLQSIVLMGYTVDNRSNF